MYLDRVTKTDLDPCPFCGAEVRIISNHEYHKLVGQHKETCLFDDDYVTLVPATDEGLAHLVKAWHHRPGFPAPQMPADVSVELVMELVALAQKLPNLTATGPIALTPIQIGYIAGKLADMRLQRPAHNAGVTGEPRWIDMDAMPSHPKGWYWAAFPGSWVWYSPEYNKARCIDQGTTGWEELMSKQYWGPWEPEAQLSSS